MNKQIEKKCQDCLHYEVCRFVNALAVANVVNAENCRMFKDTKGYRKASDVAREIFEEIEKALSSMQYNANTPRKTVTVEELKEQVDWVLHEVVPNRIADLKKKYESEGTE